jgi:hypothetical protein
MRFQYLTSLFLNLFRMRCIFKRTIAHRTAAGGSSPTRSSGCPEVRLTGRSGHRIIPSRARSMPSITPRSRMSAKMMATSRPPISRVASAASALSALDGVHLFVFKHAAVANGVQRRPRRSIRLDVSVALAPWLDFRPEGSSRSAFNRRTSAARRRGSGIEMTSAKAVRNPPASVNGATASRSRVLAPRVDWFSQFRDVGQFAT